MPCATAAAPSVALAPGRFSTTMVWPRCGSVDLASARNTVSAVPPAGNGTIIVTGRAGKASCACAKRGKPMEATDAAARNERRFR